MAKRRIRHFTGWYKFLSNFYPISIRFGKHTYPSAEHLFQFLKTVPGSHWESAVRLSRSPGMAKKMGQQCALWVGWEDMRVGMMAMVLRLKFQDKSLASRLRSTGTAKLIEGNTWHDNFWGDCTCQKCRFVPGKNMLGLLLMRLRNDLGV